MGIAATLAGQRLPRTAVSGNPSDSRGGVDFGRYTVKSEVGRGGCGVVERAFDTQLQRDVAVKRILGDAAQDARIRESFLYEARITGQLQHPGIVPVHELGSNSNGDTYYVMKLLQGTNLQQFIQQQHALHESVHWSWFRRKWLGWKWTSRLGMGRRWESHALHQAITPLLDRFIDVCHTVAFAHEHGFVHRDIKPANVMVGPYGETMVVDWGLAVSLTDTESSQSIPVNGTPAYMSPEQARGESCSLSPKSDIYSLGVLLYEIIVGHHPFVGSNLAEVFDRIESCQYQDVLEAQPAASRALAAICRKSMDFEPANRYASAIELAADMRHYLAGEPVGVYRESPLETAARWSRRHQTSFVVVMISLLILLLASIWVGYSIHRAHLSEQRARQEIQAAHALTAHSLAQAHVSLLGLAKSANAELSLQHYDQIDQGYRVLDQQNLLSSEDKIVWAEGLMGRLQWYLRAKQMLLAQQQATKLKRLVSAIVVDPIDIPAQDRLRILQRELSELSENL